jgi:geranylgeranyl diphosphate synthase type II
MLNLSSYLDERRGLVDRALDERMPPEDVRPATLHRAMRYSLFGGLPPGQGGGKRLRPILCLAACEAAGSDTPRALIPAAAIELLHTYTLVHDDLPSMDNDDLRRGRPTTHKVFGEANAILAGDALLTLAFEWIAGHPAPAPYPPTQLALELASAAGSQGVIGGQVEDLAAEGSEPSADLVDYIHARKTGDLIRAAIRIGAIAGAAKPKQLEALSLYGQHIGLAFQIADDLLDTTSTSETLGKTAGKDAKAKKATYVAVHGIEAARQRAGELVEQAIAALHKERLESAPLEAIAKFVVERGH